jgi:hypothetical protein
MLGYYLLGVVLDPSELFVSISRGRRGKKRSGSVWDNGRLATTRRKFTIAGKKRKKNVFFFWL